MMFEIHLTPAETHIVLWPVLIVASAILTGMVMLIIHAVRKCREWTQAVDCAMLDENYLDAE